MILKAEGHKFLRWCKGILLELAAFLVHASEVGLLYVGR